MIFVSVGANPHPFNRIVKKIDNLVKNNKIKEEVILQIGNSSYVPKNIKKVERFIKHEEYLRILKRCSVFITHAGVGSIVAAHKNNKPVIVVPRRKRFKEHIDDHQIQIAKYLKRKGICYVVYNIDKLEEKIKLAKRRKLRYIKEEKPKIIKIIRNYVKKLDELNV